MTTIICRNQPRSGRFIAEDEPDPVRNYETLEVTVKEVRESLARIAEAHPELAREMKVADAMLSRLDTIRQEAPLYAGNHENLRKLCGSWDDPHTLYLR